MMLPVRPPIIVHHQAALDNGVTRIPNSLAAIDACLEADASFVEVDVTALGDEDYLLVHDPRLESETTGHGWVGATPARAARSLYFRYSADPAARVPLLIGVGALFLAYPNESRLQLDFKNTLPFRDDEPLERLVRLIEPLRQKV